MSKNNDHLFDKCQTSSGLVIKNLPEFVGSLSSSKVGIVFSKAETEFRNNCFYEKDDNEQQVTSTSSDTSALLPSTSRSLSYDISSEKNDDPFTKTLKIIKNFKSESNNNYNNINFCKRKLEKIPTKSNTFTNYVCEEAINKKKLKNDRNDFKTENLLYSSNKLNDIKFKEKNKFNKITKGGYQEPNIDYLFEDNIDTPTKSFNNNRDNLDYLNDYSKDSGFKKQFDLYLNDNQESSEMMSKTGSSSSFDKTYSTFKDFKRKEDNKRFENYNSKAEVQRQTEKLESSNNYSNYNYEQENVEKKIKKSFEPITKRSFNSSFVIPKKSVESTKSANNNQNIIKKNDTNNKYVKNYFKETNQKVYSNLIKEKQTNKTKSDITTENDNLYSASFQQPFKQSNESTMHLLNENKTQNFLSTNNKKKFIKNNFNLYNQNNYSDTDSYEITQANESKDFEEVEVEIEYDEEKASRGFELNDLPQLFGNLLSSKVGFILEKASKYKPNIEETTINNLKQSVSASTSTQLKNFLSIGTETNFLTADANTQTIKRDKVSTDTQTSTVFMTSIGTQTSPIIIKKRTVGIQNAINKNQTVGTQTRKPKMLSDYTQTIEQKTDQYSDTALLNQTFLPYKEHVYAQEDFYDEYFSSTQTTTNSNYLNNSNETNNQSNNKEKYFSSTQTATNSNYFNNLNDSNFLINETNNQSDNNEKYFSSTQQTATNSNYFNNLNDSNFLINETNNQSDNTDKYFSSTPKENAVNDEELIEGIDESTTTTTETQPFLEYSPSMIERVLNIIHGR